MEKVSIIIPISNLENYLEECLGSLQKQTYGNLEIICVDDASTDNSSNILHKWEMSDERVIVLSHHTNQGAGAARNTGLKRAVGKYLLFLDGDDVFSELFVEKMVGMLEQGQAQVGICGYYFWNREQDTMVPRKISLYFTEQMDKDGFTLNQFSDTAFQLMDEIAWNKIFRRDFVEDNRLYFQEQHNANDQYFTFQALLLAEKIVYLDECLVYYRQNVKGQLSKSIPKSPKCIWSATKAVYDFMCARQIDNLYKKSFHSYVVNRLLFSLYRVEGSVRRQLLEFYRVTGIKELGMENCQKEEFLNSGDFDKYIYLSREAITEDRSLEFQKKRYFYQQKSEQLFKWLQKQNLESVLWGAGDYGQSFLEEARKSGYRLAAVADMNLSKQGKIWNGYSVEIPEMALKKGRIVLITNTHYGKDICECVRKQKCEIRILDLEAYYTFDINEEAAIHKVGYARMKREKL